MLFTIDDHGKSGSAVQYALRDRDHAEELRPHPPLMLYGDAAAVDDTIKRALHKQKYVPGCIASGVKFEQMLPAPWPQIQADILRHICGGLPPEEFALAIIGHVESEGWFHTHVAMGTLHLPTGRTLPMYRHADDALGFRALMKIQNLRWSLPDPDARPMLSAAPPHRASAATREHFRKIDAAVCHEFVGGRLHDRSGIRDLLRRLGVEILHENSTHIVVRPPGAVWPFKLAGRKYEADFTRGRLEALLSATEREQSRPFTDRLGECVRAYQRQLEARHQRFVRALGSAVATPRHRTKGRKISERKSSEGRDAASAVVERRLLRGPLSVDHYLVELPLRTFEWAHRMVDLVHASRGATDAERRSPADRGESGASADIPRTIDLRISPGPLRPPSIGGSAGNGAGKYNAADMGHDESALRDTENKKLDYDEFYQRLQRLRKKLALVLARREALRRLDVLVRAGAQRIAAFIDSQRRLAGAIGGLGREADVRVRALWARLRESSEPRGVQSAIRPAAIDSRTVQRHQASPNRANAGAVANAGSDSTPPVRQAQHPLETPKQPHQPAM